MKELKVLLMGPPQITRDNVRVEIRRRKVLALLAYLAVMPGTHNRDELSEIFYPGHPRERARADFRQTLSVLRSAVGECWLENTADAVLLSREKGLAVDVSTFHALLDRARSRNGPEGRDDRMGLLTRAVRLYRGHFMAGFFLKDSPAFEQWQATQEESLRGECSAALEWIVDACAASGRLQEAIDWAGTALSLDPLEEGSHRRIMGLLARAGRRAAALRQYERCRQVLEDELGCEPDEETRALRDEIRSGRVVALAPPGENPRPTVDLFPPASEEAAGQVFLFVDSGDEISGPADGAGRSSLVAGQIKRITRRVLAGGGSVFCASENEVRAVFRSAGAALATALRIQLESTRTDSPRRRSGKSPASPRPVRGPRIAIHAGVVEPGEDGRTGTTADRTASLLRASHRGQILVSGPALESAGGRIPADAAARSLGIRQLDDLGPPVSVYQLAHPALPSRYPRLRTLEGRQGNLRCQLTSLVGRQKEVSRVVDLVKSKDVRCVTLTGPGGTGKTRLALHAAARLSLFFAHGVYVVDLAGLRSPDELVPAVASTLGLREPPGEPRLLLDVLVSFLRSKRVLLVLDTFEHLMTAARFVSEIVESCPGVKMLVSSREPLRVRGECEVPVPPLGLPGSGARTADMLECEAVRLFAQRAKAVRPGLVIAGEDARTAAEICARLDGLPLAIELVAARIKVLSPAAILEKLSNRLALLTHGGDDLPPRQRALRSEMAWSYDLLPEAQKRIFRRLGIFAGHFSVEAAERVCSEGDAAQETLDGIEALADKSLLRREPQADGSVRLHMLETIREFARELLDQSGERPAVERRFCAGAVSIAEEAAAGLYGPRQAQWFERLDAEQDNLRAALTWLCETRAAEPAIRLAGALGWYWFRRGCFTVGEQWLQRVLSIADGSEPPGILARAQYHLGWIRLMLGSMFYGNPDARDCFRESLASWRRARDERGGALCMAWLSWCEADLDMRERCSLADRAVAAARSTGDAWVLSLCLRLAHSFLPREDEAASQKTAALEESIQLARETGDPFLVCQAIHGMGDVYRFLREEAAAEPWYLESLERAREIGDSWSVFDTESHLGWGYANRGELARAEATFADALRAAAGSGARAYVGQYLAGLAHIARRQGKGARALRIGGAASAIRRVRQPGWDPRLADGTGLPPGIVEREWNAGRSMTTEQAVQYALGERLKADGPSSADAKVQ